MLSNDIEAYFAGTLLGDVLEQDPIFCKATFRPKHGLHTITYKIIKVHVVYYGQFDLNKVVGSHITSRQFDFSCRNDFASAKDHLTMLLMSRAIVYEMKHKTAVGEVEFVQSLLETV